MNQMFELHDALDKQLTVLDAENLAQIEQMHAAHEAKVAAQEELAKIEKRKRARSRSSFSSRASTSARR